MSKPTAGICVLFISNVSIPDTGDGMVGDQLSLSQRAEIVRNNYLAD